MLLASCKSNEVNFNISPDNPATGQTVRFTNITENGEDWSWDFGDGSTSASKSPSKVYRKPGTYTVVLKVDDKASRTCAKTITVRDSIPAIGLSDTIVYYYQPITLSADAYNPYQYETSANWTLPDNVELIEGELTDMKLKVCFTALGKQQLHCELQVGSSSYSLDTTIEVVNTPARALILARNNQVLRQRIYDYGYESPIAYPIAATYTTQPSALCCSGDKVFVLNSDRTTNGVLACYDIAQQTAVIVAKNAQASDAQGFENAYLTSDKLYFTAADGLYWVDANAQNIAFTAGAASAQKVARATEVGLTAGKQSGGVIVYNGVVLWAYDKGIMRFDKNNISIAKGTILTDHTIACMTIDPVAQKLYFATAEGLYVSTLNGEYPVLLDATANGQSITVDAPDNKLFFTTDEGVKEMPLVHSPNNETQQKAELVNQLGDVTALAVDTYER